MEPSAFDQFMRLGDELQSDYGHMFGEEDQMLSFDVQMDGDLSLLLSDLDAPCSTTSSYSGAPTQSSSSSPAASHASSTNSFPYQDMLADSSPYALESPPPMHGDSVVPMMGGGTMGEGGGYYEDYASPAGTYSSSEDSGHHSPISASSSSFDHPLYDLEAGCGYDYGCGQPPLQRRSSSEDSCEFAAPPAARRVLRMQQAAASPPAAEPQQQPARVVYVLPPQQQQLQEQRPLPQPPRSAAYKVAPPPTRVVQQARPPPVLQLQQQQQAARPAAPAAPAATAIRPVVVKQQQQLPKTTVLLARTANGVQLVSTNGARLVAPIKVEPVEEVSNEEDLQYFRKQEDRKQKNRAAAQQSRLRRRCELDELRSTVSELTERNRELQEENGRLKRRVMELESSAPHWAPPRKRVAVAGAAATCLMVFVMMFAFQATPLDRNLSPFSLPVPVSRQISEAAAAHSRVVRDTRVEVAPATRALLAIEDYDEEAAAKKESVELAEYAEALARSRNETSGGGGKEREGCGDKAAKRYPNQTETIRLNTELNNWVESHDLVEWASGLQGGRRMFTLSGLGKRRLVPEDEEKRGNATVSAFDSPLARVQLANGTAASEERRAEVKKQPKKKSPRGEAKREAAKERAMRDRAWKHLDMVSPGLREHGPENRPEWSATEQQLQQTQHRPNGRLVGGTAEKEREWRDSYERLAAAVQQRTDTLYVVAMKDYLLLPAIERNATSRPRISLILPAVMNGTMTTANNQIMLMRLDLDVVGTGTIHLAEGLLPLFLNLSIS